MASELREAIELVEAAGVVPVAARQRYAAIARYERQSPEMAGDMLRWATSTQQGATMYAVIREVEKKCPDHPDLPPARRYLLERQLEAKHRLQKLARTGDRQALARLLDEAQEMGIEESELNVAERHLTLLETVGSRGGPMGAAAVEAVSPRTADSEDSELESVDV